MHLLRRLAALVLAAAATAAGACGKTTDLRVGLEPEYPPFESVDASDAVVGFDVDLVRALSAELGRPLSIERRAFDALIPELQAGRVDLVCSGMSWTAERAKVVDFSRPYLRTSMGVLVSAAKAATAKAPHDLDAAGTVIAVQRGTTGESKAREAFPKADVRPYDNERDASAEVEAGRAHAFVYDMASVRKLAAQLGDRVRVLDGDLGGEDYCMAFPKGSPLVARANALIERESAEGGLIDRLIAQWKPEAKPVRPGAK